MSKKHKPANTDATEPSVEDVVASPDPTVVTSEQPSTPESHSSDSFTEFHTDSASEHAENPVVRVEDVAPTPTEPSVEDVVASETFLDQVAAASFERPTFDELLEALNQEKSVAVRLLHGQFARIAGLCVDPTERVFTIHQCAEQGLSHLEALATDASISVRIVE